MFRERSGQAYFIISYAAEHWTCDMHVASNHGLKKELDFILAHTKCAQTEQDAWNKPTYSAKGKDMSVYFRTSIRS